MNERTPKTKAALESVTHMGVTLEVRSQAACASAT